MAALTRPGERAADYYASRVCELSKKRVSVGLGKDAG